MTQDQQRDDFFEDKSALAAEFVLGLLSHAERQRCQALRLQDLEFARLITEWEQHLFALHDAVTPQPPPRAVFNTLEQRLFGLTSSKSDVRGWRRIGSWFGIFVVCVAAFAAVIYLPRFYNPTGTQDFIASLESDASDVRYLALYKSADGTLKMRALSGAPGTNKDFELWLIEGGNAPKSLGVLPENNEIQITITANVMAKIVENSVFAISLEPDGGSPTGQPTGPVLAAGNALKI